MIKELERQFIKAQSETNLTDRLRQIKIIRKKVIEMLIDPSVPIKEKEAVNDLLALMAFASN